jgi:hypothetical protein
MRRVIAAWLGYFAFGGFGLVWKEWADYGLKLSETKHALGVAVVSSALIACLVFGWGI